VPWERVFVYRNLEISRDQWWKTPAHLYATTSAMPLRHQAALHDRARQAHEPDHRKRRQSAVNTVMGELASIVTVVDSMLQAHETVAAIDRDGVLWPSQTTLYAVMAMQSELNGRMLEIVRELAGAAMITLPSSVKDFAIRHGQGHRPLHAVGVDRCPHPGRDAAHGLGLPRIGIRQPARPIREILTAARRSW